MTISHPLVTLHESPDPFSREIIAVPEGDYAVTNTQIIEWAGGTQQWFEITAQERTGWVEDDPILTGPKSAECP